MHTSLTVHATRHFLHNDDDPAPKCEAKVSRFPKATSGRPFVSFGIITDEAQTDFHVSLQDWPTVALSIVETLVADMTLAQRDGLVTALIYEGARPTSNAVYRALRGDTSTASDVAAIFRAAVEHWRELSEDGSPVAGWLDDSDIETLADNIEDGGTF